MRMERRQPTRAEWAAITSSRPVVRRVLSGRPEKPHNPVCVGPGRHLFFEHSIKQLFGHRPEGRLVDSVAKGEIVEAELNAFIGKRDKQRRRDEQADK
jgi:hypothetical protein